MSSSSPLLGSGMLVTPELCEGGRSVWAIANPGLSCRAKPRHLLLFQFSDMQSEISRDSSTPLGMTEAQDYWYSRPGSWLWVVVALGAALRFYLVVFTDGTQDVSIWERHARDVHDHGLIGHYHGDPSANHPPVVSEVESLFLRAADATGIPFGILLRAPFAF